MANSVEPTRAPGRAQRIQTYHPVNHSTVQRSGIPTIPTNGDDRGHDGDRNRRPREDRVYPSLECTQAGQGDHESDRSGEQQDADDGRVDPPDEPDAQNDTDREQGTPDDGGDAADAERHGETPSFVQAGVTSAQPEPSVERAEQDVGHVERAEWTFFEDRVEFLAISGSPASRVAADQERPHGGVSPSWRRPIWANSDRPRSCSARFDAPTAVRR